jgi:UDP-N-acetylglucosamine acyltransferase
MAIDESARIHPAARLGDGVSVGPFAVIEEGVEIGPGCEIRAHAVIRRFTRMGAGNAVHEGAVLGGEPQDLAFSGGPSRLEIGDANRIREGVTIHRSSAEGGVTRIGSGCFLMAMSHVAHDCVVEDGALLANNVALAGHVSIGAAAFLSGGVVVHQFCRVGRLAMVGGNTKVIRDCLPFVVTDGFPARARGLNLVGLRRAGFGAPELRALKAAYRTLLRSGRSLVNALDELAGVDDERVAELVAFVRGSKRSFHRDRERDDA